MNDEKEIAQSVEKTLHAKISSEYINLLTNLQTEVLGNTDATFSFVKEGLLIKVLSGDHTTFMKYTIPLNRLDDYKLSEPISFSLNISFLPKTDVVFHYENNVLKINDIEAQIDSPMPKLSLPEIYDVAFTIKRTLLLNLLKCDKYAEIITLNANKAENLLNLIINPNDSAFTIEAKFREDYNSVNNIEIIYDAHSKFQVEKFIQILKAIQTSNVTITFNNNTLCSLTFKLDNPYSVVEYWIAPFIPL
jgi:hypothetical protein